MNSTPKNEQIRSQKAQRNQFGIDDKRENVENYEPIRRLIANDEFHGKVTSSVISSAPNKKTKQKMFKIQVFLHFLCISLLTQFGDCSSTAKSNLFNHWNPLNQFNYASWVLSLGKVIEKDDFISKFFNFLKKSLIKLINKKNFKNI